MEVATPAAIKAAPRIIDFVLIVLIVVLRVRALSQKYVWKSTVFLNLFEHFLDTSKILSKGPNSIKKKIRIYTVFHRVEAAETYETA